MNDHDTSEPSQTPQEEALIAAHAQRAAELRIQLDLLVLRSMAREIEQQPETTSRASAPTAAPKEK